MHHPSQIAKSLYEDAGTLQRFYEFLGGECLDEVTTSHITHADGCKIRSSEMKPPSHLPELLAQGLDVDRSLLDHEALLVHLDIEYVNFDSPTECYLNPLRCFELQEPVIQTIHEELLRFGIRPLHLLTGQGHHFIWKLEKHSPVISELITLALTNTPHPTASDDPAIQANAERWEAAFSGLGLVMEFLAARIKYAASEKCSIPVELTALNVGESSFGHREMISIDISEYGDPLWTRVVRMPFTNYLKPWKNGLARDHGIEHSLPPIFTIPFHENDILKALEIRTDVSKTRELAQRACVRIPEQSRGMVKLVKKYINSPLRPIHQQYNDTSAETDLDLSSFLDRLPPCTRQIIEQPNNLLLKPSGMKHVTRCLMAMKIPPSQIAQMISKTFQNTTHQWGNQWDIYSPEMRAHFYTRVFSDQILTGLDHHLDFNCVSVQDQGFCFNPIDCNLQPWRDQLPVTINQY